MRVLPFLALGGFLLLAIAAAAPATKKQPDLWRTDLKSAQAEAEKLHKPLLVLFRCPVNAPRVGLDKELSDPSDSELRQLLTDKVIPVRVSTVKRLDLNLFDFDYDLTFAVVVVNANGKTLGRWGTPKGESVDLLKRLIRSSVSRYGISPGNISRFSPSEFDSAFPEFSKSKRSQETCYHCHYIYDAEFKRDRDLKEFRKTMLYLYPPPETVGITVDSEHPQAIRRVQPDSPASRAGLQPGDEIKSLTTFQYANWGEYPIITEADFRYALNSVANVRFSIRIPLEKGNITVRFLRNGREKWVVLKLSAGWRKYDISWRASQGGIPPFLGIWEKPLTAEEKAKVGIPVDRIALRISSLFTGERWKPSQGNLRVGDIIVAVGGVALPDMTPGQFHSYIRLNYEVGQPITLSVLRDGKRTDVTVTGIDFDFQ